MTTIQAQPSSSPSPPRPGALLIDEVMPRFDANVVQHVVVNADPRHTYRAVLDADLMDDRLTGLMVSARDLPNRLRAGTRSGEGPADGAEPGARPSFRMGDLAGAGSGWVVLRDEPGVELLAGLVGRFWQRDYGIVPVTAEEFLAFDRPGYARTLAGLVLHPYGEGRTLLTYESRTRCTDDAARRRFAAYWLVLRPFVRLMLRGALVSMKRHAEHGRSPRPTTSFAPLGPVGSGTEDAPPSGG
ncbi:hypothetical protein E9549_21500 [Blastococcus sp. MG754426]|uniref:hypothetical protein n=1 Tax=unclassified Blastococcus TaxID=2619396 RepID=UPI001EF01136|nr:MULTISPECIES: hypothetical protein [unclassified Blastococcus]MCF6509944.1 hypothetical protein [Blastococcus sp. MG754426]MCF6514058.1 hypothetical protein [Blastococcus sp. MG754427]MCF6737133.1 hypothetical protein [Blastococcus sp. KM273129]